MKQIIYKGCLILYSEHRGGTYIFKDAEYTLLSDVKEYIDSLNPLYEE